jgi:hypothetical protein
MSTDDRDNPVDEEECQEPAQSDEESTRDSFDLHDEMNEAFPGRPMTFTGGQYAKSDAELPKPIVDSAVEDAHAPPFTVDNQVCIADTSAFVIRDSWGDVLATFKPEEVKTTQGGYYRVATTTAIERLSLHLARIRERIEKERPNDGSRNWSDEELVASLIVEGMGFGHQLVIGDLAAAATLGNGPRMSRGWIEVEPIRPTCEYYLRQLDPPAPSMLAQGYKRGSMNRYCTVRRSVAIKLQQSADRVHLPMFDLASHELLGSPGSKTPDEKSVS